MDTGINLAGYDFIIIGLLILFIGRGIWLGLIKQVTGLVALFLGYVVASQYHDRLFPFLKEISDNPKVVFAITFIVLFIVTYVVIMLIGKAMSYVVEITISKWFDRLLGAMLGVVQAGVIIVLMHMVLGSIVSPENTMLRDCRSCKEIDRATDYARAFIKDEEVRKALIQQTPAISTEAVRQFIDEVMEEQPQNEEEETESQDGAPLQGEEVTAPVE